MIPLSFNYFHFTIRTHLNFQIYKNTEKLPNPVSNPPLITLWNLAKIIEKLDGVIVVIQRLG